MLVKCTGREGAPIAALPLRHSAAKKARHMIQTPAHIIFCGKKHPGNLLKGPLQVRNLTDLLPFQCDTMYIQHESAPLPTLTGTHEMEGTTQ